MLGRAFLVGTSTKLGLMCLALMPVRLESTTPQSLVKHSTTETLCFLRCFFIFNQVFSEECFNDGKSIEFSMLGLKCLLLFTSAAYNQIHYIYTGSNIMNPDQTKSILIWVHRLLR